MRWKSSNSQFINNVWDNPLANSATGFEITPLRSYLEGPMHIRNVTISGNKFVKIAEKKKNELITQCQGMGHSHSNPPWKCTENVVIEDNEWIP